MGGNLGRCNGLRVCCTRSHITGLLCLMYVERVGYLNSKKVYFEFFGVFLGTTARIKRQRASPESRYLFTTYRRLSVTTETVGEVRS